MTEETPTTNEPPIDRKQQANLIFAEVNLMIELALRSIRIRSGDPDLDVQGKAITARRESP